MNLPKDAEVFVDGEKVAVTWPVDGKPVVISVTAGKHKVSVKKDGLELSGDEVTVQAEGKQEFIVRHVPPAAPPAATSQDDDRPASSEEGEEVPIEDSPTPPTEVAEKGVALGSVVDHVAQDVAVKGGTPRASGTLKPGEGMPLSSTRLFYVDEFDGPPNVLPKDPGKSALRHGRSDGAYFIDVPGNTLWGFGIHGIPSDCTCEVVARVFGDNPTRASAWAVLVNSRAAARGFFIRIDLKGQLFLAPSPWKNAAAFRQIDPRIGPIAHPAIKPAGEFNRLLLRIRKRELVIFVNGVQVCQPVRFAYDLTPAGLQFGASGPGKKRAEFDRIEIREFVPPSNTPPKAEAARPTNVPTIKPSDVPKPRSTSHGGPLETITNTIGMKLVLIPAGEFLMGSPDADPSAISAEKPQHRVRITRPFYLGIHEVTQGQYRAVMGKNPSRSKGEGSDDLPVEKVSWVDAVEFCNKLSEREKRTPFYRVAQTGHHRRG